MLNAPDRRERLKAAQELAPYAPPPGTGVNLRVQTSCSGTEDSPCMAVWKALESGLGIAGLSDYESVEGAREFIAAAGALNLPVTVGMECRVSFADTALAECGLNGMKDGYIALHGIPHNRLTVVENWMAPYKEQKTLDHDTADVCPPVAEALALASRNGIVPAYIVSECPDDGWEPHTWEKLVKTLWEMGFRAVRYTPDSPEILREAQSACRKTGLLELSGSEHGGGPEFIQFTDAAWALIGQERRAMENVSDSLFSDETAARLPDLARRVGVYRDYAKRLYGVKT